MNIEIRKGNIAAMEADAIVNAANSDLDAGAGVCGAIFAAADYGALVKECERIGHCDVGKAVLTPPCGLKAKAIIHAVGPHYWDEGHEALLYSAYLSSLELAEQNGFSTIAFPMISTGIFSYPKREATDVAISAIRKYGEDHPDSSIQTVFLMAYDNHDLEVLQEALAK